MFHMLNHEKAIQRAQTDCTYSCEYKSNFIILSYTHTSIHRHMHIYTYTYIHHTFMHHNPTYAHTNIHTFIIHTYKHTIVIFLEQGGEGGQASKNPENKVSDLMPL